MNVDFDQLLNLFKTDPHIAEVQARLLIDDYINSLDGERKLRAQRFQWRIDHELENCHDPKTRMNKMVEMFWEGVRDFQRAVNFSLPQSTLPEAKILEFPSKIKN